MDLRYCLLYACLESDILKEECRFFTSAARHPFHRYKVQILSSRTKLSIVILLMGGTIIFQTDTS